MSDTITSSQFIIRLRRGMNCKGITHSGPMLSNERAAAIGLTPDQRAEYNSRVQRGSGPHITDCEKVQRLVTMYGSVKDQFIKESSRLMGDNITPDQRIKQAEAALAQAILAKQVADETAALDARLNADESLASATAALLGRIRTLKFKSYNEQPSDLIATFRKELTPLAESYGVKIVLVGDRTSAVLVSA